MTNQKWTSWPKLTPNVVPSPFLALSGPKKIASFELLFVETALASVLYEDAAVHVTNIIDNPNVSSSDLVTLAKLSSDFSSSEQRLELLDAILKIMSENEAEYESVDLVTIIYAAELRKLNRFKESEDLISSHFAGRTDEKSKRLLALEAVDLSIAKQSEALSEDIEALLSLDLDFKTNHDSLSIFHKILESGSTSKV